MLKGTLFSLSASFLFGGLYYLSTALSPLSGESIYGFRIWVTLPFLFIALVIFKQAGEFRRFLQKLRQSPRLILVLCITSAITASQMWLFLWAPNNNAAIDVSIGYLLMPIAMVAVGRFIFQERLSPLKIAAILFAIIGVLLTLITAGTLSWATLMVLLGYPLYFSLRKYFAISHLSSFICEIVLMLPAASYFVWQTDMDAVLAKNPLIYEWLMLLGLVSGSALIAYVIASSLLPINVLGLLSYVEPASMLVVSFLIGEVLDQNAYVLMLCLSIAIALLVFEGIFHHRKGQK
ncbi:permease [[Actinobacillus] muris]|uniref:Permease n=1 Tax=Muribacter muris TaxID=67855 RepID=A0A0J5P573_9PAST|nr:EamA family transporter RarD [Muribacter muris]KMK50860.1 permease [[Actinobacillus] muris] [Muribacter muris]